MLYTSLLLALSASTALAAPSGQHQSAADRDVTVQLTNSALEIGSQTNFVDGKAEKKPPVGSKGPYTSVTIRVGKDAKNKDIRCKLLDRSNKAIQGKRGENTDITFADGGKGEWKLSKQVEVAFIICDPAFVKGSAPRSAQPAGKDDNVEDIRVQLSNQSIELGIGFTLKNTGKRDELKVGTSSVFDEITVTSPKKVKDTLRCQILDKAGKPITAKRGENVDTTFSDAGKGAWTFKVPAKSAVSKIICDPAFKKAT
ncbi:hypothetical protein CC80DRAFT_493622 [Byssothecium circinans]|uniref:Uncharacterized protein n=1 Tax=Byssothecium circinans TaxID=147558 RepID=A0A6A5TSD7_9PLEO|nr:hypothetical protein CC80DRAFT_493622 [Byssothecium circinans]